MIAFRYAILLSELQLHMMQALKRPEDLKILVECWALMMYQFRQFSIAGYDMFMSAHKEGHNLSFAVIGHYTKEIMGITCGFYGIRDVLSEEPLATFEVTTLTVEDLES